jgi:hypothetical protein
VPWLLVGVLLGCARGHVACAKPGMTQATHADDDGALSVNASLQGQGAQAFLVFTWANRGSAPLLLLTHVDTDAGPMFDAIEIRQGARHAPLKSPRKAVALRFCLLPAGHSHAIRVMAIQSWLTRLGFVPGQAWQVDYVVPGHVKAPASETTVECGGDPVSSTGPTEPAARPWHGRVQGPTLRLSGVTSPR